METTFAFRELARQAIRADIADVQKVAGKLAAKYGPEYVHARLNELERKLAYAQEDFVTTVVACPSCAIQNRVSGQKAHTCGKCRARLTPPEPVLVPATRRGKQMHASEVEAMKRKINDVLGGKPWRFEGDEK